MVHQKNNYHNFLRIPSTNLLFAHSIHFGLQFENNNSTLFPQFRNIGENPVFVAIQPIKDPFELNQNWLAFYENDNTNNMVTDDDNDSNDSYSDDNQSEEVGALKYNSLENVTASKIFNECFENIFSRFKFETYFQELKPFCETHIKVKFKELKEVGYFLEKFQLNIYEQRDEDFVYIGGQVNIQMLFPTKSYYLSMITNCIFVSSY